MAFFCNHSYHTRCLKLAIHKARSGGGNDVASNASAPEGKLLPPIFFQ